MIKWIKTKDKEPNLSEIVIGRYSTADKYLPDMPEEFCFFIVWKISEKYWRGISPNYKNAVERRDFAKPDYWMPISELEKISTISKRNSIKTNINRFSLMDID